MAVKKSRIRWAQIATWFTGRRSRWVTILAWVGMAVAMTLIAPSLAHTESPNPPTLPATASSVVAQTIQNHVQRQTADTSAGLVVFYRQGGLTHANLLGIHRFLVDLSAHPLPNQTGAVAFARIPAEALSQQSSARNTTLVIPLTFQNTSNAKTLAAILTHLGQRLRTTTGHDGLTVPLPSGRLSARLTGPMGIAADTSGLFKNADVTLLAATTIIILILLLLIYRSPILPWIPLVGVGLAYMITTAILSALAKAHLVVLDTQTIAIMTVLMFGAGTDYTLFVVSRYRSLLWVESDAVAALQSAYQRVSSAVMVSAATVMVALLTLLVSIYGSDHQFAIPFAVGVGMTALASLTLVPALLSVLGRRAFFPYTPHPSKAKAVPTGRTGLSHLVTHRSWAVVILSVIVLAALAVNSGRIHTTYNLVAELPSNAQSVQGYHLLARAEGAGALSPVSVVVSGQGASRNLAPTLQNTSVAAQVSGPQRGSWHHRPIAIYSVQLRQNPLSTGAMNALAVLQRAAARVLPAHTDVYLGGETAQNANSRAAIAHDTHWVIPLVLAVVFLLLLFYLRSLVAALYLIGTVLLSFLAALGAGWIFLHDILGLSGWAGGVTLYSFVFLVALGEDYNIFMLSAIWEQRRQHPMTAAIVRGVRESGPVISAAGLILAGTFAVLTGLPLSILLEFGSVTAIGVLLDTFVVRSMLVPAITALLGDRAMWPKRPHDPVREPSVSAPG